MTTTPPTTKKIPPDSPASLDPFFNEEHSIAAGELNLAVKTWGEPGKPGIIALHGWQDNAATFDQLAPRFPEYYWVVPDLPGHGRSDHRGPGAEYTIWSYGVEVMALAGAFSLDTFTLVGHSMGGGIAGLLAGLFPERIEQLVLLDLIGAITTPATDSPAQLRLGIEQRISKPVRRPGLYPTRAAAIDARAKKGISREAAMLLGERGIAESGKGYYWGHDPRLALKTLLSMSDEQVAAHLQAITCPVLLIMSEQAVQREAVIRQRAALVRKLRMEQLGGGHHQHLDGDVAGLAALIKDFFAAATD